MKNFKEWTKENFNEDLSNATMNRAVQPLSGQAKTKFKQFANTGTNIQDASAERRRNTLLATIQSLGYNNKQILLQDIRIIANDLQIPE